MIQAISSLRTGKKRRGVLDRRLKPGQWSLAEKADCAEAAMMRARILRDAWEGGTGKRAAH